MDTETRKTIAAFLTVANAGNPIHPALPVKVAHILGIPEPSKEASERDTARFEENLFAFVHFANHLMQGKVDSDFLAFAVKIYLEGIDAVEIAQVKAKPLQPRINYSVSFSSSFDALLQSLAILFINHQGDCFKLLRKCRFSDCRKFFLPANKKGQFCSDTCRAKHSQQKNKKR